jgi:hypothetical protein
MVPIDYLQDLTHQCEFLKAVMFLKCDGTIIAHFTEDSSIKKHG